MKRAIVFSAIVATSSAVHGAVQKEQGGYGDAAANIAYETDYGNGYGYNDDAYNAGYGPNNGVYYPDNGGYGSDDGVYYPDNGYGSNNGYYRDDGYGGDSSEQQYGVLPLADAAAPSAHVDLSTVGASQVLPDFGQQSCYTTGAPWTSCGRDSLTKSLLNQVMNANSRMSSAVDGICGNAAAVSAAAGTDDDQDDWKQPQFIESASFDEVPGYHAVPEVPASVVDATDGVAPNLLYAGSQDYRQELCSQAAYSYILQATSQLFMEVTIKSKFIAHYAEDAAMNQIEGPRLAYTKLVQFMKSVIECTGADAYNARFFNLYDDNVVRDGIKIYSALSPYSLNEADNSVGMMGLMSGRASGLESFIIGDGFLCADESSLNPQEIGGYPEYSLYMSDSTNKYYHYSQLKRCSKDKSRPSPILDDLTLEVAVRQCQRNTKCYYYEQVDAMADRLFNLLSDRHFTFSKGNLGSIVDTILAGLFNQYFFTSEFNTLDMVQEGEVSASLAIQFEHDVFDKVFEMGYGNSFSKADLVHFHENLGLIAMLWESAATSELWHGPGEQDSGLRIIPPVSKYDNTKHYTTPPGRLSVPKFELIMEALIEVSVPTEEKRAMFVEAWYYRWNKVLGNNMAANFKRYLCEADFDKKVSDNVGKLITTYLTEIYNDRHSVVTLMQAIRNQETLISMNEYEVAIMSPGEFPLGDEYIDTGYTFNVGFGRTLLEEEDTDHKTFYEKLHDFMGGDPTVDAQALVQYISKYANSFTFTSKSMATWFAFQSYQDKINTVVSDQISIQETPELMKQYYYLLELSIPIKCNSIADPVTYRRTLRDFYDSTATLTGHEKKAFVRSETIAEVLASTGVQGQPIFDGNGAGYYCAFFACKANNGGNLDGNCFPNFNPQDDFHIPFKNQEILSLAHTFERCMKDGSLTELSVKRIKRLGDYLKKLKDRTFNQINEKPMHDFYELVHSNSNAEENSQTLVFGRTIAYENCYLSQTGQGSTDAELYEDLQNILVAAVDTCYRNRRRMKYPVSNGGKYYEREHGNGYVQRVATEEVSPAVEA